MHENHDICQNCQKHRRVRGTKLCSSCLTRTVEYVRKRERREHEGAWYTLNRANGMGVRG